MQVNVLGVLEGTWASGPQLPVSREPPGHRPSPSSPGSSPTWMNRGKKQENKGETSQRPPLSSEGVGLQLGCAGKS